MCNEIIRCNCVHASADEIYLIIFTRTSHICILQYSVITPGESVGFFKSNEMPVPTQMTKLNCYNKKHFMNIQIVILRVGAN